ncbi:MAG: GNAT family N-acetyltransferase [Erysipelotrichaceae bacterium]|nr:GNAT family N-acetyltransferase [Erysipelotrichaceae bacterium]
MIKIEKAKASDAEDILEFTKCCGSESDNLTFGKEGIPYSVEEEAKYLSSFEDSDSSVFYVVRDDDKIIGTGGYTALTRRRLAHRGELSLTIGKAYWNKGIGTMLVEKLLDFACNDAGSEIVSLEVRSDNKAAVHLYEKFGFKKIGTFRGFMKINDILIDCDIMELVLNERGIS